MLTLALNEDVLVPAVPADRALESRIVGAPFLADSHGGQCIERSFCGSKRAVRARINKELAQRAGAACDRSRPKEDREKDRAPIGTIVLTKRSR